jgi:parallel beta-helix repeat protein
MDRTRSDGRKAWHGLVIVGGMVMLAIAAASIPVGNSGISATRTASVGAIGLSVNHAPISINGDAALAAFPNKTGAGIPGNPYVIKDLVIDGGGTTQPIYINGTSTPLIIRNCTMWNSPGSFNDGGLVVRFSANVLIENNTARNNSMGILVEAYCSNITVANNTVNDNLNHGMWIDVQFNSSVIGNSASRNGLDGMLFNGKEAIISNNVFSQCKSGIYASSAEDLIIVGNVFTNCSNEGILFSPYTTGYINKTIISGNTFNCNMIGLKATGCFNNTIAGNTLTGNQRGITLLAGCTYNTVSANYISDIGAASPLQCMNLTSASYNKIVGNVMHGKQDVLRLDSSSSHNVVDRNNLTSWGGTGGAIFLVVTGCTQNNITRNLLSGVAVSALLINSPNNRIYGNGFSMQFNMGIPQYYPVVQTGGSGSGNTWTNGTHGNYYFDYTLWYPGASNNGTHWNETYVIDAWNADDKPLVTGFTNVAPTIGAPANIIYPHASTGHSITWTVADGGVLATNYTIERNGTRLATGTWISGDSFPVSVDGLAMGTHAYTFAARDGWGGVSTSTVIVTVINAIPVFSTRPAPSYVQGDLFNDVAWAIDDKSIGTTTTYTIYRDSTAVASGSWIAGAPLVGADLATLAAGTYNFTIVVDDGLGGTANDTAIVEVKAGVLGIETPWFVVLVAGGAAAVVVLGVLSYRHKKTQAARSRALVKAEPPPFAPSKCPACGGEVSSGICFGCGAKICPTCGAANTGEQCSKCGVVLP